MTAFFLLLYSEYLDRLREPRNVIDIVLVFAIIYTVLKLVRGTRAVPMAAGIAAFALLYWISIWRGLATLEYVMRGVLLYLPILIIVLFQSEIRQAFITVGNRIRLPLFTSRQSGQFGEGIYDEIVLAATTLASTKTGALIVIERGIGLKNVIDGGVRLDAELSYDLIVTIFNPATPLHDGAVVIRRHRVAAAACFLPLTLNPRLSKDLGTRHRAAIGITEDTDAVAVVVSEETGLISFMQRGQIKRGLDATKLRSAIFDAVAAPARRSEQERQHQTEAETNEVVST
ncbi:MAG: TIGR00159 family protein [Pyrinomonadaceae bacterium]|nr:TIGR00159 family protein [Pyrinomonadaceae bacterium]MDQ3584558.1 diadenylate cyclase CdaA [Acidobacteriota bacterium]